jgi:hypothetical protein
MGQTQYKIYIPDTGAFDTLKTKKSIQPMSTSCLLCLSCVGVGGSSVELHGPSPWGYVGFHEPSTWRRCWVAHAQPPPRLSPLQSSRVPSPLRGPFVERPRLVSFANGGANTLMEDLSHHMGYYRLPNNITLLKKHFY